MFRGLSNLTFIACLTVCVAGSASAKSADPVFDSIRIDRELSRQPDNPAFNFLKAAAYERSAGSSSEGKELAKVGYLMALREDSGFWRAAYQLGLLALDERDADGATTYLLQAAYAAPREPRVFFALAKAAYCAGYMELAAAALDRALAQAQPAAVEDIVTTVLVRAAIGDGTVAEALLSQIPIAFQEAVRGRLEAPRALAELKPIVAGDSAAGDKGPRMALVDVVIIRRNERSASSSGINLLDALSLQFGSNLLNRSWSSTVDRIDPSQSASSLASTSSVQLTVPAITYSLNLANAKGSTSQIEARPTLLIYDGIESRIFSGGTLTFATDGQLSSSTETREVGLNLSVKPQFVANDVVNLTVKVSLENFLPTPPAGTFRQAVQTEKSSTEVAADIRFGQTLMISSGQSISSATSNSRVPVVGKMPIFGRLFSAKTQSGDESELLVLLSMRRASGQAASRDFEQDQQARLIGKLFPSLSVKPRREMETRWPFYQVANPVKLGDVQYLAPVLKAVP